MKKLLVLGMLLLAISLIFADTYTIGEGTSAGSTNPYYGYTIIAGAKPSTPRRRLTPQG